MPQLDPLIQAVVNQWGGEVEVSFNDQHYITPFPHHLEYRLELKVGGIVAIEKVRIATLETYYLTCSQDTRGPVNLARLLELLPSFLDMEAG